MKLPIGEYAIFGSGPMGIRNLREMHDIDIIITKKIWSGYLSNPEWKIKRIYEDNNCYEGLKNDNLDIEMWRDWYVGWDIEKMIKEAETIDNLPFVKLDYLIKWKKFFGREKDLKDVEIINKFLLNERKKI